MVIYENETKIQTKKELSNTDRSFVNFKKVMSRKIRIMIYT